LGAGSFHHLGEVPTVAKDWDSGNVPPDLAAVIVKERDGTEPPTFSLQLTRQGDSGEAGTKDDQWLSPRSKRKAVAHTRQQLDVPESKVPEDPSDRESRKRDWPILSEGEQLDQRDQKDGTDQGDGKLHHVPH
jgi:hypothetical protein